MQAWPACDCRLATADCFCLAHGLPDTHVPCRVVFDDDGEAVDPLALLAKEEEFGEEEEQQGAADAG